MDEVRRIVLFDIASLFDYEGHSLPVNDWGPEVQTAVAGVKVVRRLWRAGDEPVVTADDVKLWGKIRALALVATYLGLRKKHVEHSGVIDLVARLQAARPRGKAGIPDRCAPRADLQKEGTGPCPAGMSGPQP